MTLPSRVSSTAESESGAAMGVERRVTNRLPLPMTDTWSSDENLSLVPRSDIHRDLARPLGPADVSGLCWLGIAR